MKEARDADQAEIKKGESLRGKFRENRRGCEKKKCKMVWTEEIFEDLVQDFREKKKRLIYF